MVPSLQDMENHGDLASWGIVRMTEVWESSSGVFVHPQGHLLALLHTRVNIVKVRFVDGGSLGLGEMVLIQM